MRADTLIRVLVADDQAAVRDGFAALVEAQDNMIVAGTAGTGREAVDLARRTFPSVILMDIRMPVLDGIEATRLICADPTLERTRVLVLTTFDLDEHVYGALRAGASGFLLKDTPTPRAAACDRGDRRRRGPHLSEDHTSPHRRVRRPARSADTAPRAQRTD